MIQESRVSTHAAHAGSRMSLVRDTAFNLFNLEVDLGDAQSPAVSADIRVARGPLASMIDVTTSWSTVIRTRSRAKAAVSGNVLVYLIHQGGSWFENDKGEQFQTTTGSIVVGSQDAAYRAVAAPGKEWRFHALSVPEHLLALSVDPVRQEGFQLVPANSALKGLLTSYLEHLCQDFAALDGPSMVAALKSLDHLLSAALGDQRARDLGLAGTVADERYRAALRYIEDNLESPALSPESIAAFLCISPRQMHRVFEGAGKTVAAEVRRIRLERAVQLLQTCPLMPITDVAFACGFESLATFYRCFKTEFQATASEIRAGTPH
jgi:AraC-like DNA-binding protein